jgi:hypothetical protein
VAAPVNRRLLAAERGERIDPCRAKRRQNCHEHRHDEHRSDRRAHRYRVGRPGSNQQTGNEVIDRARRNRDSGDTHCESGGKDTCGSPQCFADDAQPACTKRQTQADLAGAMSNRRRRNAEQSKSGDRESGKAEESAGGGNHSLPRKRSPERVVRRPHGDEQSWVHPAHDLLDWFEERRRQSGTVAIDFLPFGGPSRRAVRIALLTAVAARTVSAFAIAPDESWLVWAQDDYRNTDIMMIAHRP